MIVENENLEELYKEAGSIFEKEALALLGKKKQIVLGLVGGRSVSKLYELLLKEQLPWEKMHIFLVDERLVPLTSIESNYKLVMDSFAQQLIDEKRLPKRNIHPFVFEKGKENEAAEKYAQELLALGGFDIVVLGAGEDGHVAALFPNHLALGKKGKSFITFNDSPKPPTGRMTALRELLATAQVGMVFFVGEAKAEAFKRFCDEKISVKECPAKIVKEMKNWNAFTDLQD